MFTTLIAGLCAVVIDHAGFALVGIGTIKGQTCEFVLMLQDNMTTPVIEDERLGHHRFGARIGEFAAIVNVDQMEFRVPRGEAL
jgi:hypothetical protein